MEQVKHTQGPWEWKQSRGNNIYEYRVFTQHRVIAELDSETATSCDGVAESEIIKANARLIASAPELLEVCRKVEAYLQGIQTGKKFEEADLVAVVQSAINKARGAKGD